MKNNLADYNLDLFTLLKSFLVPALAEMFTGVMCVAITEIF